MKRLYQKGYNNGGLKFKFATIGMKGDVVSRFKPHSMHGNAGELTLRLCMAGTRDHPFEDLSNTVAWMQLGKIREYWVEIRTTGTCGSKEVDQITTSVRGEGEGSAESQPRAMALAMPGLDTCVSYVSMWVYSVTL